jgi:ribosome biogenesis GTPase A
MAIQWYPGHMFKAGKEMKKVLPQVDLIIEVLDARIPFSSANPMLAEIRGDKPTLKILNKADLADPQMTQQWQDFLEQEQGVKTLALTAHDSQRSRQIIGLSTALLPAKAASVQKIQAMIMGIPNVGKSTLINSLAGRPIAKTGNEPAVTKMQQRIKLDDSMVLHDTPGVLWPNLENQGSAYRLAITGAIKETAFENADIALYAVQYLMQQYPKALLDRFKLESLADNCTEMLNVMASKRGCLRSGGKADVERISKILVTELRAGTLGPITLETPEMMVQELIEVDQLRIEKAEKKAARKRKSQPQR